MYFFPPFIPLSFFGWSVREGDALGWDHMILSSRHFRKTLFIPGLCSGSKVTCLSFHFLSLSFALLFSLSSPKPALPRGCSPPLHAFYYFIVFIFLFYIFFRFFLSPLSWLRQLPRCAAISAGRHGLPGAGVLHTGGQPRPHPGGGRQLLAGRGRPPPTCRSARGLPCLPRGPAAPALQPLRIASRRARPGPPAPRSGCCPRRPAPMAGGSRGTNNGRGRGGRPERGAPRAAAVLRGTGEGKGVPMLPPPPASPPRPVPARGGGPAPPPRGRCVGGGGGARA